MWEYASIAIVGTVKEINTYSDSSGVYWIVEIVVKEYHIDVLNKAIIKIRAAGGKVGDMGAAVSTQVDFEVGQYVFVFLHAVEKPVENYHLVPYAYGKFLVK